MFFEKRRGAFPLMVGVCIYRFARTLNSSARLFTPDSISLTKHISLLFFLPTLSSSASLPLFLLHAFSLSHEQKKAKVLYKEGGGKRRRKNLEREENSSNNIVASGIARTKYAFSHLWNHSI
jgi:hypothetical protein